MRVRAAAAAGITSVLGARPVANAWCRARPGLRIVAYHAVTDGRMFASQLDELARRHTFVSGDAVGAALRGAGELPADAVWLTFDDGDASVLRVAQPLLAERSIPATLYICPGLVDPPSPPWWTVVEEAGQRGEGAVIDGIMRSGTPLVRALKTRPDAVRRQVVADLAGTRPPDAPAPATLEELRGWLAAGQELGNHTWDHPCLDRCDEQEQTAQIERAHRWFEAELGFAPRSFAYPNGDRTEHAAAVAAACGYDTVLLFDHAVAGLVPGERELSRLRLDAADSPVRARAVVSGAHADVLAAGRALRGGRRRS